VTRVASLGGINNNATNRTTEPNSGTISPLTLESRTTVGNRDVTYSVVEMTDVSGHDSESIDSLSHVVEIGKCSIQFIENANNAYVLMEQYRSDGGTFFSLSDFNILSGASLLFDSRELLQLRLKRGQRVSIEGVFVFCS